MDNLELILRQRWAPETLPAEALIQKAHVTWTLVMKASDYGEDYVFDACNQHNKANGRQPYQSFILPADLPGVGYKGDWVIKRFGGPN
ncbi:MULTISPECIES: hypothetical protein [Pseudomonas syringae group]|uniref:Uncharacterized protein n=2 Tax=Pseudomonas syringae group TaxID=136849 RepID=A0A2K4WWV1_PSESX|nr:MULTISPECIES: hypothetical protein [Pseudomonas syringae group]AVB14456.1 hypothetical protein BKM19_013275 [Pseudomonas amygdali pv. morsprunorum]KWS56734.1 hypothetical protein AL056_27425 [Pseudomonas amygdali pv. morsprunorum]KWS62749.1 hypothetical protein AL054_04105 [Pseudomonas amygdali pv. morsprunorum]PHX36681.1 hypothetical protein AO282_28940 [Pseudomonas amygdali pv. morsprunorum]POC84855.1 hypothetical protein BKM08_20020 [Pseudomonas amygdali pv. morsprunorum]